jgi:hypothetical protein
MTEEELRKYTRGLKVGSDGYLLAGTHTLYNTAPNMVHPSNCISLCNQNEQCISWAHTATNCKLYKNMAGSTQYKSALKYRAPARSVFLSMDKTKTTATSVQLSIFTLNWVPEPKKNEIKIQYKSNTSQWINTSTATVAATTDVTNGVLNMTVSGLTRNTKYDFKAVITRDSATKESNIVTDTTKNAAAAASASAQSSGPDMTILGTGIPGFYQQNGRVYSDAGVLQAGYGGSDNSFIQAWNQRL